MMCITRVKWNKSINNLKKNVSFPFFQGIMFKESGVLQFIFISVAILLKLNIEDLIGLLYLYNVANDEFQNYLRNLE